MESDSFQVFTFLAPADIRRLGGIPRDAIIGLVAPGVPPEERGFTPETFQPNPSFVRFMHDVIGRCAHDVPALQAEARRVGEGFVYLIDGRTATPQGAVPPEDIIGFVRAAQGRVVPHSYQPNANHRIVSDAGLFELPADLHECLVAALRDLPAGSGDEAP